MIPMQDVGPPKLKGPFFRPFLDVSGLNRARLLEVTKVRRGIGAE